MADMKPLGIDQTTGQQRSVESNDSIVNNLGNQTELAITQTRDFSGNLRNNVRVLFPWSNPTKLDNPATLPTNGGVGCAWSPNNEFLAVSHTDAPRLTIYQRTGRTFNKLANPGALPSGSNALGLAWSHSGEFLAVANGPASSPSILIYQRSGSTFTKLIDPSTLPAGTGSDVDWSSKG